MTQGGTLTIVLSADPAGLDPVQLQGVQNWAEAIAVAGIYDALFYPGTDNTLQPKIGKAIRSADGGRTWDIALRPDVRFSDGTAFDADAVRFNWERIADPANRSPVGMHAAAIERMEAVDPLTLRVTLKAANPHWDMVVARYLSSIGSPVAIEASGEAFARAPVGAGPFLLAEWTPGQTMRLVRNPGYWQPGKPHLDEIVVLTGMADAAPKYEAMASGRAQVALEPLGDNIPTYADDPERFDLMTTPETGGGVALAMNVRKPPFDDLRIRRALSLVLDSGKFVQLARYGRTDMAMTTVDREGTQFAAPDICLPKPAVAEAQRLIDEVSAETGAPVSFTVETFPNEGHKREAFAIKEIVESALTSITVDMAVGTVAELVGKWRTGEYQSTNYAVRWASPAIDLPASFASAGNIMGYASGEVDALLARLAGETDAGAMVEIHRDVLRHVLHDLPVIWLSHKEAFHVVDKTAVRDWKLFYSLRPLLEDTSLIAP